MTILEIFRSFTVAIADIEFYRSSVESAANREYRHLFEQKSLMTAEDLAIFTSSHNMFFQDATSGQAIFYGSREVTVDDAISSLVRHTNRQHQWFLAEAYELFEEFVKRAYAFMGMDKPSLWPLRDFGGIQWGEVKSKDFQWYLEQARTKKDAPLTMLRQFRKVLPRMAMVEKDNRLKCDLQTAVMLIGFMRHRIVHARGIIPDKAVFTKDLLSKLGHSGKGMDAHQDFIDGTLLLGKEDGAIRLLSVPAPDSQPPFHIHYDIFTDLIRYLLLYAHQTYLSLGGQSIAQFDAPRSNPKVPDSQEGNGNDGATS